MFNPLWEVETAGDVRKHVLNEFDARQNGSRCYYDAVISFFQREKVELFEIV
jgi:hypothetical protein